MISGLDTDTIVKQLVSAQKLKYKKTNDKQTLLTWKQEKWKDLNTKLFKLYTTDLSKMRLSGNYLSKAVTSSNDSLVKVTGDSTAPLGSHKITVNQLANAQNVTGAKISVDKKGKEVTNNTTLQDLGVIAGDGKNTVITIKNGTKEQKLVVTKDTTLNDFVESCKSAGLTANFDTSQKKLFIGSINSGEEYKFSITSSEVDENAAIALQNIKDMANYSGLDTAGKSAVDSAVNTLRQLSDAELTALYEHANDSSYKPTTDAESKQLSALKTIQNYALSKTQADSKTTAVNYAKGEAETNVLNSLTGGYQESDANKMQNLISYVKSTNSTLTDADAEIVAKKLDKQNYAVQKNIEKEAEAAIANGTLVLGEGEDAASYAQAQVAGLSQVELNSKFQRLVDIEYASSNIQQKQQEKYDSLYNDQKIQDIKSAVNNNISSYKTELDKGAAGAGVLGALGLGEIDGTATTQPPSGSDAMVVVAASNSSITLDGATLTGTSNTIVANGLTITATGLTTAGQFISINVANNSQANYDMVKNFVKSYNDILKEMNTLYYAGSTRDYAPLSDDEKASMSDDQVEKWETKIKDSILRRDDTLGSLTTAMKQALQSSVTYNGKQYSLAAFGITTSKDYTEKGLLHIAGDKDDTAYSTSADKLLKAFNEDPDAAANALAGIAQNLYKTMTDKMSSIPNVRSIYTFYNDKEMATEQLSLKKKIAENEDKLTALENKYYKQFSAMETAMAKLQSQTNALSGLLGTSS
ncbi:flagellar filament capping protein FliD [Anaerocolumna jejuensis]|nr:flagellar filament capping protein FliD [Anaerocolumna jejuensis]